MPSTMLSTTSPVTCTSGCVTRSRPPTAPTAKPSTAFVSADTAATGDVLDQARRKTGDRAELRAAAEREEDHHDEGDVGRDVADAQRRRQRGVGDAATKDREREHAPHAVNRPSGSTRSRLP